MAKSDEARAREHRLAAKLRENLRRRKAPADPGRPVDEADRPAGLPDAPAAADKADAPERLRGAEGD